MNTEAFTPSLWYLPSASFALCTPRVRELGQGQPAGGWGVDANAGKWRLSPVAHLGWGAVGREPLKGKNPLHFLFARGGGASLDLFGAGDLLS